MRHPAVDELPRLVGENLKKFYGKLQGDRLRILSPPKRLTRLKSDRRAYAADAMDREARLKFIDDTLPHVEYLILLVDPEWKPEDQGLTRPRRMKSGIPPQGWVGEALVVLREEIEPLTIAEICRKIGERHGLDLSTVPERQKAHTSVTNGLKTHDEYLIYTDERPRRVALKREP